MISADWSTGPGAWESFCYEFNRNVIVEGMSIGDAQWFTPYEFQNLYGIPARAR